MVPGRMPLLLLLTMAAPLLFAANAQAEEKEPSAILEIGGAGDWGLPGGVSSITVVIFCWRILLISESMDHHDLEIMDDRSID